MIIYPNPSNGKFHIELPDASRLANLMITNEAGRIIQQVAANHKIVSIDLSDQTHGLYTIVMHHDGQVVTKRIMIKKRA